MSTSRKSLLHHDHVPEGVRIPILPPEVLLSIIGFLPDKNDLRNVRLSGKAVAFMVEPRLFDTITLVPYRECLQDFVICMKENPRIAHHVQTLRYKVQSRCIGEMSSKFRSHETKEVMAALHRSGLSENDEEEELSLLADCLRVLPSLRKIHTVEVNLELRWGGSSISGSSHPYFRRLLGPKRSQFYFRQCSSGDLTAAVQIAILALSRLSDPPTIAELEISAADAFNIFVDVPDNSSERMAKYKQFISQLKSVSLAFQPPSKAGLREWDHSADLRQTRQNVGTVLASARQLERLRFKGPHTNRLRRYEYVYRHSLYHPDSWLADMVRNESGSIRHEVTFPNLKFLELGRLFCCESELTALVNSNRHKLEKLVLYDMLLAKHPSEQGSPCWVRTFKAIRECFIPEVTVYGEFTNRGSQLWSVDALRTPRTLKSRVEDWLSGKGDDIACPIQFAAVAYNDQGNEIIPSRAELSTHLDPDDNTWIFRIPYGWPPPEEEEESTHDEEF